MTNRVTLVETPADFAALQTEWNALAGDNPFRGWDWADCWRQQYLASPSRLFVLTVRNAAGELIGLAPWHLDVTLVKGRVVRFIGSNEVCGDRLTILAAPNQQTLVVDAIADFLAEQSDQSWDLVELVGGEETDTALAQLADRMSELGHVCHSREDLNCWKIALPGTWDDYLATLSRTRRNRTRKMVKQSEEKKFVQQKIESEANFAEGWNILIDLHQRRRRSIGEPGCFASSRYAAFHDDFARRMLAANRLRVSWTTIENEPAAVAYDFLGDGTVYNYQSGFDPDRSSEHPGWVNLVLTLKWSIEHGYRTYDMLRGDESYKASFGAVPERLVQRRVVGRKRSARLRHAAWKTQALVRRWAREQFKPNKVSNVETELVTGE